MPEGRVPVRQTAGSASTRGAQSRSMLQGTPLPGSRRRTVAGGASRNGLGGIGIQTRLLTHLHSLPNSPVPWGNRGNRVRQYVADSNTTPLARTSSTIVLTY